MKSETILRPMDGIQLTRIVLKSPSKKFLKGVRKLIAALWMNSRSAPPICFSVSPHFIKAFPAKICITHTKHHFQDSASELNAGPVHIHLEMTQWPVDKYWVLFKGSQRTWLQLKYDMVFWTWETVAEDDYSYWRFKSITRDWSGDHTEIKGIKGTPKKVKEPLFYVTNHNFLFFSVPFNWLQDKLLISNNTMLTIWR